MGEIVFEMIVLCCGFGWVGGIWGGLIKRGGWWVGRRDKREKWDLKENCELFLGVILLFVVFMVGVR